jgi:hypothetical protein
MDYRLRVESKATLKARRKARRIGTLKPVLRPSLIKELWSREVNLFEKIKW